MDPKLFDFQKKQIPSQDEPLTTMTPTNSCQESQCNLLNAQTRVPSDLSSSLTRKTNGEESSYLADRWPAIITTFIPFEPSSAPVPTPLSYLCNFPIKLYTTRSTPNKENRSPLSTPALAQKFPNDPFNHFSCHTEPWNDRRRRLLPVISFILYRNQLNTLKTIHTTLLNKEKDAVKNRPFLCTQRLRFSSP